MTAPAPTGLEEFGIVGTFEDDAQAKAKGAGLGVEDMRQEPEMVHDTLIAILKTHEDRARVSPETTQRLLGKVAG